jgi:DNA-3-methyladenine glycosylase I
MAHTYCDAAASHEWHGPYHGEEYGFPLRGDAELFERLVLEINQAGLSWLTILKKRERGREQPAKPSRRAGSSRRSSASKPARS